MADSSDPFSLNVAGVADLVNSRTNKVDTGTFGDPEGASAEKRDTLALDMDDAELLRLKQKWELAYAPYEVVIKRVAEKNKESYLGKRADGQWLYSENPIAANLQFEAEETFLSAALAKNPEPVVYADNSKEGNQLASDVKTMLQFHADQLVLRRKLAFMVRQWSIHHLGVLKIGWNEKINDVAVENRKIKDFVFDPEGHVDAYGDFSSYLGERITVDADKLAEMFSKHKQDIMLSVDNQGGTKVTYTEWWTDEMCFSTYKDIVLEKHKNPYLNRPQEESEVGEDGIMLPPQAPEVVRNHFATAKKPYVFLSVYSLQEQPHDITGNIEQNIPNQNLVSKRTEQIDFNISRANNSDVFSQNNFNQETAKQAANALRNGRPVLVPSGGPIAEAIHRLQATSLPDAVFKELEINKDNLRSSWGIQGITATQPDEDQTARGMILNQSHDTSRIGGGIGDAIEQVADNVFNWLVQLYYVFYDEQHFAAIMGNAKAVEYVVLQNTNFNKKLIVSVSPNSMKPKDEITNINLAQALYDKGAIGPKTLLKMVDFPNPEEAAADGALWVADKLAYIRINFPELFAQLQGAQVEMANAALAGGAQGNASPEEVTEPEQNIAQDPASAALSQVQLPAMAASV